MTGGRHASETRLEWLRSSSWSAVSRLCLPALALAAIAILAFVPRLTSAYHLAFIVTVLEYVVLATAWTLFSGTTRYMSLATAAFFGLGAYLVVFLGKTLPMPALVLLAAAAGFGVAFIVGFSTLRLRGPYFVIFTLGLSELIRQMVIWWEINQNQTVGRIIHLRVSMDDIYYYLLGLTMLVYGVCYSIGRSRVGYALRAIGEDETAASHVGINNTRLKVLTFAVSAAFMSMTGAVIAPRFSYMEPNIAFDPLLSFTVLIMALLGGIHRLYGPAVGIVPLIFLSEYLSGAFPFYFGLILGVCFMAIVYFLPVGVVGLAEDWLARARAWRR